VERQHELPGLKISKRNESQRQKILINAEAKDAMIIATPTSAIPVMTNTAALLHLSHHASSAKNYEVCDRDHIHRYAFRQPIQFAKLPSSAEEGWTRHQKNVAQHP
jgi:hypothetical protein